MPAPSNRRQCTWMCGGIALLGLAGIAGTARIVLVAIEKVMSGRGLEIYRTVWLVEFHYIGVLLLFGAVVMTLTVGGALWFHDWSQWRSLEYGQERGET